MGFLKVHITLVPWDPDSPEHVERLYQQRIACGWNENLVEEWRALQRAGKKALQFVVLSDNDTQKLTKLSIHTSAWPLESTPIFDTAASLGGKPRVPTPSTEFIPVGHISLDSENNDPDAADPTRGIYSISSFYVSRALQSSGLGRAAMDEIERQAASEPLNAKTLTIGTFANDYEGKKEMWDALKEDGHVQPKISLQDWYARRGYVAYKYVDKMWSQTDSKGRVWWSTFVGMRKDIK